MMLQPSMKQYIEQEIGLMTKLWKKAERSPSLKAHSHLGGLWILVFKQATEITQNPGNSIYSERYFAWEHIPPFPPLLPRLIQCDV